MVNRAELWRALVALDVPHITHITYERKKILGSNQTVGAAFRNGTLDAETSYAQTRTGNFTCAAWRPGRGPIAEVIVWWSYTTPIVVLAPEHNMCIRSTYSYSVTTSGKHMHNVATTTSPETLYWDGHIGDGILTPTTMVHATQEGYAREVRKITSRRKPETWLGPVYQAATLLQYYCQKLGLQHTARTPREMLQGHDKALAKMTGWQMLHPDTARSLSYIDQLVTEHGISS